MLKPFYRQEDLQMRVMEGLIKFKDRLVVVSGYEDGRFRLDDVKSGDRITASPDELDLTPIKLGNTLLGNGYVYISRKPVRKFKQTLTRDVLNFSKMPFTMPTRCDLHHLAMPALGTYPKIETALSSVVDDKKQAMPFSHDWGVAKIEGGIKLIYRNMVVGKVTPDRFILMPEKFYLEESLKEVVNV